MTDTLFVPSDSVRHLQTMLREISFVHPQIPRLIPNGLYDEKTLESVMVFQRDFFPPVTGVVDQSTWEAIVLSYRAAAAQTALPRPIHGFPPGGTVIHPGQEGCHVLFFQSLCKSLAIFLSELQDLGVTGIHLGNSVENARWLQRHSGRPETGTVAAEQWNLLVRLYECFVHDHSTE